jgi:hypothetical protein
MTRLKIRKRVENQIGKMREKSGKSGEGWVEVE